MRASSSRSSALRLAALLVAASLVACAPAASQPTPTPTPVPTAATTATTAATPTPTQTAAASPTKSPIGLPTFASIAPAGNGVVWVLVAASRLFLSADRGDTWSERTIPTSAPISEIAFVSDSEGWAFAAGSAATQCQAQSPLLFHTADGAKTWQQLNMAGLAEAQCKEHLSFRDTQHGYLVAWDPNNPPVIYRTADGGKTWARSATLPDPPGFTTQPAGFTLRPGAVADFGSALFTYATGQTQGGESSYVFRSTDGGATWAFVTTPPQIDTGVIFITATRWFGLHLPQPSVETTDAGATWHPFESDYQQAAPVAPQIAFGDASTGYATVRGTMKRTTDGGAHWTAIKTPGTLSP